MKGRGKGYIGSERIEISTVDQVVINGDFILYEFSFINDADCTVTVNGEHTFFLRAGQGFSMNRDDRIVERFTIKEANVPYNYIGAY